MVAGPTGTVTFLFTDIEASTELWETHPDEMRVAVEAHDELLRATVAAHGGHVFSTGGDGFAVAFARARDACLAAVEAQRRLDAVDWPDHAHIGVRMGIHTGEVAERDGDYFGPAVNRTARLAGASSVRQIVVSLATEQIVREHLPRDHSLVDLGELRVAGVAAPLRVFGLLAVGLVATFPPLRQARVAPSNVPHSVAPLVGREREIARLVELLRGHRLLTLTGVGGVGKTSLALTAATVTADDFPDGSWWIELAAVKAADDVAPAVATSLGVQREATASAVDSVAAALAGRRSLLVLDNCEHVIVAAGELVDAVQRQAPTVTMLITSRQRLGVAGEEVEPVRPLPCDGIDSPAVELFLNRLGRRNLDAGDQAAVVEMCSHLEGLPLAIELAASRCRALRPTDVAERLRHRLSLLADPRRRVDRQRTLEATLRWSYELLDPIEQRVLRRLAVFMGGFTLDALEAVCGGEGLEGSEPANVLASLVDHSLIERTSEGYRLLETTREFALTQLDFRGDDVEQLRLAHARWFVDFAVRCRIGLRSHDENHWVARLDADWPNVRAAYRSSADRGDVEAVTAILTALVVEAFWRRPEVFQWADEAYQRFSHVDQPRRHELIGAAGWASWALGDVQECLRRAHEAVGLRGHADAIDELPEWAEVGGMAWSGHAAEANELIDSVLSGARRNRDRWLESIMLSNRALGSLMLGRWDDCEATARAAIEPADDNPTATAYAHWMLGLALTSRSRDDAQHALDHALELAESVHNRWQRSIIVSSIATLVASGEDPQRALATLSRCVDELWHAGYRTHGWNVCSQTVPVLAQLRRPEDAAIVLGASRSHDAGSMANVARLLDKAETTLRAVLHPQALDNLIARGTSMTAHDVMTILRQPRFARSQHRTTRPNDTDAST